MKVKRIYFKMNRIQSYRWFCLTWAWILMSFSVFGQKNLFTNLNVGDGLCSNTVTAIFQDSEGFMWIGTKNGLNKYDGSFVSRYQQSDGPYALGDNAISFIKEAADGNLLIGTFSGLYSFNKRTQEFTKIALDIDIKINSLVIDENGLIWIGTGKGVSLVDPKNPSEVLETYFPELEIRSLIKDKEGNIWLGTYRDGIKMYHNERKSFSHINVTDGQTGDDKIMVLTIFQSDDQNIWIGTLTNGLGKLDRESGRIEFYKHSKDHNSISSDIVRVIAQRIDGKILLGTEEGLNIFDIENERFETFSNVKYDPFSLSDNSIWSILVDDQKNVWLGTYFGGVNFWDLSEQRFNYFYPSYKPQSIQGKAVSCFLEVGGKVWVGTEDAGLYLFDPKTREFFKYPFEAFQEPLSYHNVHTILQESEHEFWIGTYTGGLDLINLKTGKTRNYRNNPEDPASLSNNGIYATFKDTNGTLWVGTIYGLNKYDAESDQFVRVDYPGLSNRFIYKILENQHGELLVLTYGQSLFIRRKNSDQWEEYTVPSGGEKVRFITMYESKDGKLYIGSEGAGIFKFENGEFSKVFQEKGLVKNSIYSIVEDMTGNLWASTNNGIFCIEADSQIIYPIKNWRFLQGLQFNFNAGMAASDGQVYFGGINGFNSFDPEKILNAYNHIEKKFFFHSIQLFNTEVRAGDHSGILNFDINYEERITLKHDQSMISITYGALDFVNQNSLNYAYFLEGLDADWNHVGNQNRATYTNLTPGTYRFHVKLEGTDSALSKSGKTIEIVVLPPFYKTTLAYLIYFMLGVGGVLAIGMYYRERVKKKSREREKKLKQQEERAFYKRKIQFFTEMAHEIRTPLSLIAAPLEKLMEKEQGDESVENNLNIIKRNADDLMSLIGQLLDFRRVESEKYLVKPEKVDIANMLKEIHLKYLGVATQKNIRFTLNIQEESIMVMIDIGAFSKIINNLLMNAFKYARTEVILAAEVRVSGNEGEMLGITVWDDGIGIPESETNNVFRKFFTVSSGKHKYGNSGGTGIGLFLAKSLTEIQGGSLRVESVENQFTTFSILFPLDDMRCEENLDMNVLESDENEDDKLTRILVVEDNLALLDFITDSLVEMGYGVIKATNGKYAIQKLKDHHIDLVLSDVMMDEMDGLELCRYIKDDAHYCHIPVILLTAKSDPEMELDGLEVGVDAYIVKPFKLKHIELVIRNLLDVRDKLKFKFSHQPLSGASEIAQNGKDKLFVKNIITYIEDNITSNSLSVTELSQHIGLSRSSLHKKLKTITGLGPNEFIKLIRLKAAAKLLNEGQYNISEVCYMSGFTSPSYFSKCFQLQFNMTPSEFIAESMDQKD